MIRILIKGFDMFLSDIKLLRPEKAPSYGDDDHLIFEARGTAAPEFAKKMQDKLFERSMYDPILARKLQKEIWYKTKGRKPLRSSNL